MPSPNSVPATDELERFASAFKNEAHLRQCLRTLLMKMGREEVRITHGSQEKGKDVVFYAHGGMNERAPYACVVKKDRITGSISAKTSAKEVLHQAEQAFDEPYTNPSNGQREQIKGVYIISPYDTPVSASESVGDRLAKQGRTIEFMCGTRLMGLFAKHWKDFLLFESSVLASYLSAMRAGLSKDTALINVILGRNLPAELPESFQQMYVPQTFSEEVRYSFLDETLREDLAVPSGLVRLADIRAVEQRVKKLMRVVDYLEACPGIALRTEEGGDSKAALAGYIDALDQDWHAACQAAAAAALKEFETLTAEDRKRSASAETRRRQPPRAAPKLPTERTIVTAVELSPATESWLSRAEEVQSLIVRLLEEDCLRLQTDWRAKSDLDWLFSSEFKAHCRLLDLEGIVPGCVRRDQTAAKHRLSFSADFLDGAPRLVLLAGPAGFGKTSFCRWQALACAESMLDGTGRVLPVYVPLLRFAHRVPNHLARRRDATFDHFRSALRCSLAGLEDLWEELLDELLQDGLIVSTGGGLRFSHLSFQEFLASEHLIEPTGERLKVPLKEFLRGDDWWREVIAFYITGFGTPSDTEEWLVRSARDVARTSAAQWVIKGALDERLAWLRSSLREAFPTFRSQYPDDGVIEDVAIHRSRGETIMSRARRRLSGLPVQG